LISSNDILILVLFAIAAISFSGCTIEEYLKANYRLIPLTTEPTNIAQWSEAIKKKDGYKCVYCSETECLDSHHLAPKCFYPSLMLKVENGITVCKLHHLMAADIFRRLSKVCTIKPKKKYEKQATQDSVV
jgi:hypothetical protein